MLLALSVAVVICFSALVSAVPDYERQSAEYLCSLLEWPASGAGEMVFVGGQRDMSWPLPDSPRLSSCFHDFMGHSSDHAALDLCGGNREVAASYDGEVLFAGNLDDGFGNSICIKHLYTQSTGSKAVIYTRYSHLESCAVNTGDTVRKGQIIARMGNTGGDYPVHLDYQILYGCDDSTWMNWPGNSIDPFINNLLEIPRGFNAFGADLWCGCCYKYVDYVKKLYTVPLDRFQWATK